MTSSVCVQVQQAMRSAFAFPTRSSRAMLYPSNTSVSPAFNNSCSSSVLGDSFSTVKTISSASSLSSFDDDASVDENSMDDCETALEELDSSLTVAVADKLRAKMTKEDVQATSLMDMVEWINHILTNAQCARGVVIVGLIYCERLLELNPLVRLTRENWKSIVSTSLLLASKVWDDISMLNKDYTYFLPFSLKQINDWERAYLRGLKYNVQVDAVHYERYFFELRDASNSLAHLAMVTFDAKHTSSGSSSRSGLVKPKSNAISATNSFSSASTSASSV